MKTNTKHSDIKRKYGVRARYILKVVLLYSCSAYFSVFSFLADSKKIEAFFSCLISRKAISTLRREGLDSFWKLITANATPDFYFLIIGFLLLVGTVIVLLYSQHDECHQRRLLMRMDVKVSYLRRIGKIKDAEKMRLKSELAKFDIFKGNLGFVAQVYLRVMCANLKMGKEGRVSLYLYKNDLNSFVKLQCFSENLSYKDLDTEMYLWKDSIVWKAWQEGVIFKDNLPDPTAEERLYNQIQETLGHGNKDVAKMVMKPRFYFAFRLMAPDNVNHVGVFLLESTQPNFKRQKALTRLLDMHRDFLSRFLHDFGQDMPCLSIATTKGL